MNFVGQFLGDPGDASLTAMRERFGGGFGENRGQIGSSDISPVRALALAVSIAKRGWVGAPALFHVRESGQFALIQGFYRALAVEAASGHYVWQSKVVQNPMSKLALNELEMLGGGGALGEGMVRHILAEADANGGLDNGLLDIFDTHKREAAQWKEQMYGLAGLKADFLPGDRGDGRWGWMDIVSDLMTCGDGPMACDIWHRLTGGYGAFISPVFDEMANESTADWPLELRDDQLRPGARVAFVPPPAGDEGGEINKGMRLGSVVSVDWPNKAKAKMMREDKVTVVVRRDSGKLGCIKLRGGSVVAAEVHVADFHRWVDEGKVDVTAPRPLFGSQPGDDKQTPPDAGKRCGVELG